MTQLLADILKEGTLGRAVREGRVVTLWETTVSSEIARHTEAVKIHRKTLYVNVKSPVWAQELNFLKVQIIDKINQAAGYPAIKDIRFKAGG